MGKIIRYRKRYRLEPLYVDRKLVGEYGLGSKFELLYVQHYCDRFRLEARNLLTLDENNPFRISEGEDLVRSMFRLGVLDETQNKLRDVFDLTVRNFLDRHLQTLVLKSGMDESFEHAMELITGRHIRVGGKLADIPSFMVSRDLQKHIEYSQEAIEYEHSQEAIEYELVSKPQKLMVRNNTKMKEKARKKKRKKMNKKKRAAAAKKARKKTKAAAKKGDGDQENQIIRC